MRPTDDSVRPPLQPALAPRPARFRSRHAAAALAVAGAGIAVAASGLVAGTLFGALASLGERPCPPPPPPALATSSAPPAPALEPETSPAPAAPAAPALAFVTELDGRRFAVLGPVRREPAHPDAWAPQTGPHYADVAAEPAALIGDRHHPHGTIARVADDDLPADAASWRDREVVMENGCRARVVGFAELGLMTGSVDYMALPEDAYRAPSEAAVIATIRRDANLVLAAELDGCEGELARGSDATPPVAGIEIADRGLARRARRALLRGAEAEAAQRRWLETGHDSDWRAARETAVRVSLLRHPATGVTVASVHASAELECGGAHINLWGVFELDANGRWRGLGVAQLDDIVHIDRALDLDGDGAFEWLGRASLGDRVIARGPERGAEVVHRLHIPFFGCPC